MSKANCHARLKMSHEIQSLNLVVEKVLIWRCEHCLMTDKKIFAVQCFYHTTHRIFGHMHLPRYIKMLLILINVQIVADGAKLAC